MSDQLELPLRIPEAYAPRLSLALGERVFANRDLDLSAVQWVGFDVDSTLLVYNEQNLAEMTADLVLERLASKGYESVVSKVRFKSDFAMRGLVIDTFLGHILKLDQYRLVRRAFHGTYALEMRTIETKYRGRRVSMSKPRFRTVDGLYDRMLASLYAAMIHALEARRTDIDYARLFEDILACGREIYVDGTWTSRVLSELPRYVDRDPSLPSVLGRFRASGKRLFVLTNSPIGYVSKVLSYLLDDGGVDRSPWHRYFSVVVTSANKPAFFRSKRATEQGGPASNRVENRTRLVEGGAFSELEKWLGASASRILYVGDHIYGDILKSRKNGSWQTTLVLHELARELSAQEASSTVLRRLYQLQVQRWEMDDALRQNQKFLKEIGHQQQRFIELGDTRQAEAADARRLRVKKSIEALRGKLRRLSGEEKTASQTMESRFHPSWGPLLREGNDLSSFGAQVQEYASLYTARVSHFQRYSATQVFRAPRKLLPHER